MERLGNDELIIIAKKVANFGAHHLCEFLLTLKNLAMIYKLPVVLRALPPEYANWIDNDELNLNQVSFFILIIENGHADYCVLSATSLMYDAEPDVTEARCVLNIASKAKVQSADYFLAMLDASAAGGDNAETAISSFTKFFRAQKLSALRLHMTGWGTPYWNRVRPLFWSRCMPGDLVLRTLCPSKHTCKGDGRLPGYNSIAPGDDHEYSED